MQAKLLGPNLDVSIFISEFLLLTLCCQLLIFSTETCSARTLKGTKASASLAKPNWLDSKPIVMVGNWDSAPIFRYRRGGSPSWYEDEYAKAHTEDAVIKLKEMGVTMAIIHFFKGFGLEAEKEQLDDARKLAALCKKHGIKVGVYVGSTIGFETFLLERPDAKEWFVPDFMGRPVLWDSKQPFRKRVYFMHPQYREYIKKVLRIAIEELHVDLIHFDNTSERAEGPVFFHPLAKEDFRSFLRESYTPETLKQRLGFTDVKYVEPPLVSGPQSKIENPLFQMWTDFRCHQMDRFYGEMARFIRGINPEVAVENNPCFGLSGWNHAWLMGIDYPRLLSHTDIIWTEEGNEADFSEDGILISKIRSYKMATTLNNKVFTYTGESVLQMAEAMAYNRQCIGMVGGMLAGYELIEKRENIGFDNPYSLGSYSEDQKQLERKTEYIKFFHRNFDKYRDIDNIADAAVLHSYSTLAFNNDRPYQSVYLFEQALIQAKIPFDVIFDNHLVDLSKYKVLVLADVECLNEDQMELIRKFVKNGGGLVATEHSSLYTESRRRRKNFGLKDIFGINAPNWLGRRFPEAIINTPKVNNRVGNGRVVYLPEVKPATEKPPAELMLSRYWNLPLNWEELIESVKWAAGSELSLSVDAPETVTIEVTKKKDGSCIILHLLNYNSGHNAAIKNIGVNLAISAGKQVTNIVDLSPDHDKSNPIEYSIEGQRVFFQIPELDNYEIAVINLRDLP
ncbi:alpha-amylase family protein [Gemmatimonadota bacterium]